MNELGEPPSLPGASRVPTLGSRLLAAHDPDEVLRVIQDSDAFDRIRDRMGRDNHGEYRPERVAYGFGDPAFDAPRRTRVAARALACIAADIWFDAYAAGLFLATRPTSLRVEIRSATTLIWNWGTFDHPALARALSASLRHPDKEHWLSFEPFTLLYERLLLIHRDEDPEWCHSVAERLSSFAVERLWHAKPGLAAARNLSFPSLAIIRDEYGVDLGSKAPTSSADELIRAAAPWYWDVFFGRRDADTAVKALRGLADGLATLDAEI